ncbi:MAG TPA: hypothetical protein DCY38_00995 [Opitutae bacterium]|nr:hypothetical protein [Opitutae bacterium]
MKAPLQTKPYRCRLLSSAIVLGIASSSASVFAQTTADTTRFFGSLETSIESTSNVFLNNTEADDVVYSVVPTLGFARENGLFSLEGSAAVSVTRYDEFSANDSSDVSTKLAGAYDGNPLSLNASVDFTQSSSASGVVGNILETDTLTFAGGMDYYISSATGISAGFEHETTTPDELVFELGETTVWSARTGAFYDYSSALRFNMSLRYRQTDVENFTSTLAAAANVNNDSEDVGFIVGVSGQLTPVIDGLAEVGLQQRSYDAAGLDDSTSPYVGLAASWTISSITRLDLNASYDFSTSVTNLSSDSIQATATLNHELTSDLSGNIGVIIEESDFEAPGRADRDDSAYSVFAGVVYSLTDWGTIGLQVNYGERDSNVATATYETFSATLSASVFF